MKTLAWTAGLLFFCCSIAASATPQLPREVVLNKEAGRMGWWLLPLKMTNRQEVLFVVDTGSPVTLFDTSFASRLEKSSTNRLTLHYLGTQESSGCFKTPQLFLGDVPLTTSSNCFIFDTRKVSRYAGQRVSGVLGMDCLRNYCVQLDFAAGKARFLAPNGLDTNQLGKAFAMDFIAGGNVPDDYTYIVPVLNTPGFFGAKRSPLLLDLGDNVDGGVEKGAIHGHYLTRFARFLFPWPRALRISQCVWDGESYTSMCLDEGLMRPNRLGIRFFARHLTTFDFPHKTLYLKKTRTEPLPRVKRAVEMASEKK